MRVGVTLRDIGNQTDAPGILVLNLMDHILELDHQNEYVLFYPNDIFLERYKRFPNTKAIILRSKNKLIWDQVLVPRAAKKEKLDLLLVLKPAAPLFINCKLLMHMRGSQAWVNPDFHDSLDNLYKRIMFPLFCRKADHIIVESEYVKKDFKKFLKMPESKMTRTYLAPSDRFKVATDTNILTAIKEKYNLPERFMLTVTRLSVTRLTNGTKPYPGKNLLNSIRAFSGSLASRDLHFVVVGKETKKFLSEIADIPKNTISRIVALDFVPQEDLPAIYSLAEFFLFPSFYESFGIPLTEAMASGCPVITSTATACPETVGRAGILVDPNSVLQIREAIDRLNSDLTLGKDMSEKGFKEMERFSWRESAKKHLEVIQSIVARDS